MSKFQLEVKLFQPPSTKNLSPHYPIVTLLDVIMEGQDVWESYGSNFELAIIIATT